MLLFCYLVLQQGSSSPRALYKLTLGLKHMGAWFFFPEPWEVNDMPTTCWWRTSLHLTPLLSWPLFRVLEFCGCTNVSKTSKPVSGCWSMPTTPPPLFFTRLHVALAFCSQAIRSYLECVTRTILHHLTDQELPCKVGPGMSRYRFGEKREWGMQWKNLQWAKEKIKRQLTISTPLPPPQHSPLLHWCPEGECQGDGGEDESRGRPVAQWWLSHLVIIAGQAYSTVSSVPSHLIPDTALPSAEIHQNLLLGPCPPCWRSALRWCLFFFKGQRWVSGSAVFPGVQINLRLGSNISSTRLFDESVGQWHALAVMPWSLAFFPCHFPPHLNARFMPVSSTWVAHKPNHVCLCTVLTEKNTSNFSFYACIKYT